MDGRSQLLTIATATAETASTTHASVRMREAFKEGSVVLDVTAAAAAAGDTLDVYVDTSYDGGISWVNIGHFDQILGNGGAKQYTMALSAETALTNAIYGAAGVDDVAAGTVRQIPLGNDFQVRSVIAGTTQSFDYNVKGLFK